MHFMRPRPTSGSAILRWFGAALVGCLCFVAVAGPAQADTTRRYAVIIGSNVGEPDDVALSYAHRDAERVAEVLRRLAGVYEENLVILREPDAERVTRVLTDMSKRIDAQSAAARSPTHCSSFTTVATPM